MPSVTIATADGQSLQAELHLPENADLAVVITHPHPQMGGDMNTPVPDAMFRSSQQLQLAALRFNFRGVGRSTGTHDHGQAEQLDVAAAIAHLAEAAPGVPIVLAGWSFGADMALTVDDERIAGWYLAAPPLRVVKPETMAARAVEAPKILAVGEHDQFAAPDFAAETTAEWKNTTVQVIDGADHFFGAQMPALIAGFEAFMNSL